MPDSKNSTHIKVFVSSTFIDMDIERDLLRNVVEPRLNDYLSRFNHTFEFVDLRHSVRTDTTMSASERERRIFNVCMDEIERCEPFFIGLMGHRYGWIPADDGLTLQSVTIPKDFPVNKRELSVTLYEFQKGIFTPGKSNRSVVYLRDMDSYKGMDSEMLTEYVDTGKRGELIKNVREYIGESNLLTSVHYTLPPVSPSVQQRTVFADMVFNNILSLLRQHLDFESNDPVKAFESRQEAFVQSHLRNFRGRRSEIDECMSKIELRQFPGIYARHSGTGVSAFICKMFDIHRQNPDNICLFYSPEAMDVDEDTTENRMYFWAKILSRHTDAVAAGRISEAAGDCDALEDILTEQVSALEERNLHVYAFCDKFDTHLLIDKMKGLLSLCVDWVEVVRPMTYVLEPYSVTTIESILSKLRPEVKETLRKRKSAGNARWLNIAINILDKMQLSDFIAIRSRLEADNEQRIVEHQVELAATIPDDTPELLSFLIDRLEKNIGGNITDSYLFLLTLNPMGCSEKDLANILDCDTLTILMLRQMLGSQIVRQDSHGNWTIASTETSRLLIDRYSIHDFRNLLKRAYDYVKTLNEDSATYQANIFKFAMLNADIPFCTSFIRDCDNRYKEDKSVFAYKSFSYIASYDRMWFMNIFSQLLDSREKSFRYFLNLSDWLKALEYDDMEDVALICAQQIDKRLTYLHNIHAIDSGTYTLVGNILHYQAGILRKMQDYPALISIINRGFSLCAENYHLSPEWLTLYFGFIDYKLNTIPDPDSQHEFIYKAFILPDKAGKFKFNDDFNTTNYAAIHHRVCETMLGIGQTAQAAHHSSIAFDTLFKLLEKQAETPDRFNSPPSMTQHFILSKMQDAFRWCLDYRLLSGQEFASLAKKVIDATETSAEDNGLDEEDLTDFFRLRAELIYLDSAGKEEAVVNMNHLLYSMLTARMESDRDRSLGVINIFHIFQRHTPAITTDMAAFAYIRALQVDLLADIHPQTVDSSSCPGYSRQQEPEPMSVKYVEGELLPMIGAKGLDEDGLPHSELLEPTLVLLLAMLNKRLKDNSDDIQEMIEIYNLARDIYIRINDHKFLRRNFLFNKLETAVSLLNERISSSGESGFDVDARFNRFNDSFGVSGDAYIRDDVYEGGETDIIDFRASIMPDGQDLTLSRDILDEMTDNGQYQEIISILGNENFLGLNEMFYLGLAYMRSGDMLNAFAVMVEMMTNEDTVALMSDGFYLSSLTNYLIAAIGSHNFDHYETAFNEMEEDDRMDEDIAEINRIYRDARAAGLDDIPLPQPPGFPL